MMEICLACLPRPCLYLEHVKACIVVMVVLHARVFFLDNFQRLMIILYYYVSTVYVCMKLFKAKSDREALSLYVCISYFNISKCFTGKSNGYIVLEECSAEVIFTGISLQY